MSPDADHYEIYYADKLWALMPAIYRTQDTDFFNANGPLREMVNRIGAQAAIVRRSIDRLWEDQSIESCDDWVISYIGNLLGSNLVVSLDARGQRLDVANTIYYRRRKGTVAILEEIAYDITGWQARTVESFRRLSRTRHSFDPPIAVAGDDTADNAALLTAQGLIGLWTSSKIGGWADLRNAYGASQAQSPNFVANAGTPPSAFDEYFHTADFRAGNGRSGWYNIAKLGVFLWRLESFGVTQSTPVKNGRCFTFDPTGRTLPLFAASTRPLGDSWVSPQEWQLPSPIATPLLKTALAEPASVPLYAALGPDGVTLLPNSLGIFTMPGSFYELIDVSRLTAFPIPPGTFPQVMIFPETGVFQLLEPANAAITVSYHYGFSAPMGAGPYDRRVIGQTPAELPVPVQPVSGGGNAISLLSSIGSFGTISIADSLTYNSIPNISNIIQCAVVAQNQQRPVIRVAPLSDGGASEWVLSSSGGNSLILDGLFFSGGDIVLRGSFDTVTITCCTFDPGTAPAANVDAETMLMSPAVFAQSIDGRDLVPTHLWIEAEIVNLNIDRCILGPVRTRNDGEVENLTITNSIVQAIPTATPEPEQQVVPMPDMFGPDARDLTLSFTTGVATLSRCTLLGPAYLHQLEGSECVFDDVSIVENSQDGCVRFSAWASGSVIPRQYRCVQAPAPAPLFVSRAFGEPGFAQLLDNVDSAIVSSPQGAVISSGAVDGSEMGAFASLKNPIKENSLLIKYREFMPLGLNPIPIHVT